MKVLIIEDEPLAASHLKALINECDTEMEVVDVLDSVKSAEAWLNANAHPALIFMDVHLGDGLCFEIFKRVNIASFIIFTTAYDQYALQAFKVNSIDYLLKPLSRQPLCNALQKYKTFAAKEHADKMLPDMSMLLEAIQNKTPQYKERFVVKVGAHIRLVKTDEIACFYSSEKATYLLTQSGNNYLVDYPLEKLTGMLDPAKFFRISRQYIAAIDAIDDVVSLGPLRLKVKMAACKRNDMLVSRDKVKSFKKWLEGNNVHG
ncbi:two component transcriptional regulator, LytTR family [Saccharicrinis carchari]|uniref:Two component transcriptional regulator, LytTR family n=1 Tax=Saccharicrinis carchari TaxID=1168039 RepID=A0A521EMB7_SACCC|nr:LytTR family DNA-binding domain-containing protein [Saccharicrinis carchari]SMO84260.1 two component transcriptional regulator, LytTR family [Saccharicrinis carchari]